MPPFAFDHHAHDDPNYCWQIVVNSPQQKGICMGGDWLISY
jgi:hypothetical protein